MLYDVAIIGTGPGSDVESDRTTYETTDPNPSSRGFQHARRYATLDNCRVVAGVDLVEDHVENFADTFDLGEGRAFTDHEEMLATVAPDIVSVCTPPAGRLDVIIDCVRADVDLRAIHCEKPMETTWKNCRIMAQECDRNDVQLTFSHQQRCSDSARRVKELVEDGAIGTLRRIEMERSPLFEAGIHQIDLCNYVNDDRRPEWVIGQIDYREEFVKKGAHNENQALGLWEYENGVHATANVGFDGGGRQTVECGPEDGELEAIRHVVASLENGTKPEIGARNALTAMEIVFGIRESARRRGRVDLPLTIDDDPLSAMVEEGDLPSATNGS